MLMMLQQQSSVDVDHMHLWYMFDSLESLCGNYFVCIVLQLLIWYTIPNMQ